MRNKTKKSSSFGTGLLIYIIILLAVTVTVWLILTLFLHSYEQSQPIYSVNEYLENISSEKVSELARPLLENLKTNDESTLISNLTESIRNAKAVSYSRESNTEKKVYYLHDGESYVEKIVLTPGQSCGFNFKKWAVTEEDLLITELGHDLTVTVPEGYSVFCNGSELDSSYITDSKTEYQYLSGLYDYKELNLPYLQTYYITGLLDDAEVYAKDNKGNTVLEENLNENYYCDNCTDSEKNDVKLVSENFVKAYVKFLSNADRNTDINYNNVIQYVSSDSVLEDLLRDAKKSNGFNSSLGDELQYINVNQIINIGNSNYVSDIEFCYITTGQDRSKTEFTNNMKLVFHKSSNEVYLATHMVTY